MMTRLILASGSDVRRDLLEKAGLDPIVRPSKIDEGALKQGYFRQNLSPDAIAQNLATAKAMDISEKEPAALVIGADQVLVFQGQILSKPQSPDDSVAQLRSLQGHSHSLISAVSLVEAGKVSWKICDRVDLHMRALSVQFIERYVEEQWQKIRWSVGCYMIEDRGIALFKSIHGDYLTILCLPIIDLLSYLEDRGILSL